MKTPQKMMSPVKSVLLSAMIGLGFSVQTLRVQALNLDLQVQSHGHAVELSWTAESEAPAYYVERYDSISGEFRAVAWLKNLAAENEPMHFVDRSVNCGRYAYQLRVVDVVGRTYFSDVKTVLVEKANANFDPEQPPVVKLREDKLYPALIISNVQASQVTKLSIVRPGEGRIITIKPQYEPHRIVIGIRHLTKGTYALAFTANGQQYLERFRVD